MLCDHMDLLGGKVEYAVLDWKMEQFRWELQDRLSCLTSTPTQLEFLSLDSLHTTQEVARLQDSLQHILDLALARQQQP